MTRTRKAILALALSQARWGTPVLAGVTALIGAALAAADEQ